MRLCSVVLLRLLIPGSFARVCLEELSDAHREEVIRLLGIAWDMSLAETRAVLEAFCS